MSYLLDTNVLSEIRKPARSANAGVRAWFAEQRPSELYVCVISILEIELGIARLERKDAAQAARLKEWLERDLLEVFERRLLSVDLAVARSAARMHVPDPRPERDALIAAVALTHGLTVVTRNVSDFQHLGVTVLNPWGE